MEYLLKASIVIAIFYLCFSLFLKRETFFNHNRWFLLIGVFTALVLPLVVITVEIPIESSPVPYSSLALEQSTNLVDTPSTDKAEFEWQSVVPIIYYLGLVIFLLKFLFQFGSLALLLISHPKRKDGIYTYVIIKNKISPFSFFKWIVFNPNSFDHDELHMMLTHEKVHVNQLHSIDIILIELAYTIFWFNPIVWLYRKATKQNLEYIADFKTQEIAQNCKAYQKLLLKTSIVNHNIALTNNFYNSLIKERIVMLQKSRSQSKKQWRYALIIPLLALVLMSMNTKEVYVETPSKTAIHADHADSNPQIEIIFTKATTDTQLEDIKRELKSNGITMVIKELKRNSNGYISSIDVDFNTENGSANYAIKKEDGISDFYFRSSKDGSFGVGAVDKKNNIVIVEEILIDDIKHDGKHTIIHKSDGHHEVIIKDSEDARVKVIKKDDIIVEEIIENPKNTRITDTIYIVKGYRSDSTNPKNSENNRTSYSISDTITTKINGSEIYIPNPTSDNIDRIKLVLDRPDKPIVVVDGKVLEYKDLNNIKPDKIKSINVIQGDMAITDTSYGEKGKNGVIIVETKGSSSKEKAKWVIDRVEVSSVAYIGDDESKNATLAYITKYTPDRILDKNKTLLEQAGITVKYSKIRRNKAGEITRIKISVKHNSGDESSASWKNDDGIPGIEYGISEGSLIARTSEMNFKND
ncbi:M56 family metallopeptidase [Winogradskyella aurantia]|uniref:Peptidase M56 domain-containing protein n=1 Tax=Winogradskyella aurantia TaxID=1915063 RepID=A0A265URK1_9FLAO|nr:M56 family metallopeptidase [Winogradskyella aurantia]OZV67943.1 hypothetical protein CA834_09810 [Winogradskyella aurantia]